MDLVLLPTEINFMIITLLLSISFQKFQRYVASSTSLMAVVIRKLGYNYYVCRNQYVTSEAIH